MRLRQQLLTRNYCYTCAGKIKPAGVMVHSTGANNPRVSRYVPGDAETGRNTGGNHWNQTNAEWQARYGKVLNKCVHAFIGRFADREVGTVQTLPWTMRGWHCAGRANNTHIGFEICEDGLTDPAYFQAVYREAVELTATLCREFDLDPLADGVVICHQEGYRRGIASNHGDVLHWFPKHGRTMDDFRAEVARLMRGEEETVTYEQWKEYMEQYRKELGMRPVPDWAKQTGEWEKAHSRGIIADQSRPQDLVTRAETAAMIVRAGKTAGQQ